jgi:hypothetical protein
MTARYIRQPSAMWVSNEEWTSDERVTISVSECDAEPTDTGLLDADGVRLFRVAGREPMGYRIR